MQRLASIFAPLLVTLNATTAMAATYYVASGGNNGDVGSSSNPWQTLQHAADAVAPGDTVIVRSGTYAGFYLSTSGSSGTPITFSAEPGVVINQVNPRTADGINLEGASYVVIEGFTITGVTRAGIRAVTCNHVTIRNNRADQNGRWGILTGFCDDLLIEGNECSRSVAEHGIYVSNSGDRPVIRGNRSWGNNANGIHMNGDVTLGGDGIISGALVENNIIHGNGAAGGSGINCDGVQDSTIRNNLLYDNHASGISLYKIDGGDGSKRNVVVNNTILVAADGRWALNIQGASADNIALNNILLNLNPSRGSIDVSADSFPITSDYNVVMDRFSNGGTFVTLSAWRSATSQDTNSFTATAAELFVNPSADDYHLKSMSPAVDRGTQTQAPPTDLEGLTRPAGAGIDIGAFELGGTQAGDAGSNNGGATGSGGTANIGGAMGSGGASGTGGAPNTGGAADGGPAGGRTAAGGATSGTPDASAGTSTSNEKGSCSCRVVDRRVQSLGFHILTLGFALLFCRRARRRGGNS
jgi:parallel beta-helix repeat protein